MDLRVYKNLTWTAGKTRQ